MVSSIITTTPFIIENVSTAVVQQHPETVLEGLQNLLNSALPKNDLCTIKSESEARSGIECLGVLTLELLPCTASIVVTTRVGTTTTTILTANGPEVVKHRNVSLQVVTVKGMEYYIMKLSLFRIRFPLTAIPLVCVQSMS